MTLTVPIQPNRIIYIGVKYSVRLHFKLVKWNYPIFNDMVTDFKDIHLDPYIANNQINALLLFEFQQ